jgi:uncharacterized protein (DUF2252 family)
VSSTGVDVVITNLLWIIRFDGGELSLSIRIARGARTETSARSGRAAQGSGGAPTVQPVRHGRMQVSPFTLYRGTAKVVAADLDGTPRSGLDVQLCGDAHLSNFGLFASPERTLLFDLNDFDETLPGPFEYDVKRMAASLMIAARNNGFTAADARSVTIASLAAYRKAMTDFAQLRTMDIWYSRLAEKDLMKGIARAARRQPRPPRET